MLVVIQLLIAGNVALSANINLQDIKSTEEKDAFVVDLKFDRPASDLGVTTEYINETIQINIPGAHLKSGMHSLPINNGRVKMLYTYQASADQLRSRIILRKGLSAEIFKENVTITPLANSLRIKVASTSPKTAAETLDASPVLPAGLKTEIDQTLKSELQTPVDNKEPLMESKAIVEEAKIPVLDKPKAKIKAESPWDKVAMIAGALLIFVLAMTFIGKQWTKAGRKNLKHNQIKVITQHYLAPRKSLAIIRVAGESILIGITDSSITPIKTLSLLDEEVPEEIPSNFQKSLRNVEDTITHSLPEAPVDKVKVASHAIKAYGPQTTKKYVDNQDDYSIQGIRQLVKEKLKDMRTI